MTTHVILILEGSKNEKEDAITVIKLLKEYYLDATCSLDFKTPFKLVIAVMLSAQCKDERANKVAPDLFNKYKM